MGWLAKLFFGVYRGFVSPVIHFLAGPGMGCRYHPTCSEYAEKAIRDLGWIRGSRMALRRIASCQPFAKKPFGV